MPICPPSSEMSRTVSAKISPLIRFRFSAAICHISQMSEVRKARVALDADAPPATSSTGIKRVGRAVRVSGNRNNQAARVY